MMSEEVMSELSIITSICENILASWQDETESPLLAC